MLKEINNLSQKDGDHIHRKWFSDKQLELIVWFNDSDVIIGFQIIYFVEGEEHAFTWKQTDGFSCSYVDGGESNASKNLSPTLVADRKVAINYIVKIFLENCSELDTHISQLVIEKLKEWKRDHAAESV